MWRDGLGTTYQQADYRIWLANFGKARLVRTTTLAAHECSAGADRSVLLVAALLCGLPRARALNRKRSAR